MNKTIPIKALFVDIGGVLLTNGWDHHARRRAAKHFKLNWVEMQERHELKFSPGGLLGKAFIHTGRVSPVHVQAIETFHRDD